MIRIKFGNHKLGNDIGIINMGSSERCPSRKLGLCRTINKGVKCYAKKAEDQYKDTCINYRNKQEEYWKNTSKEIIVNDISRKINNRRKDTKYIRFNESGDFWSQKDVDKLSYISTELRRSSNVTVYTFTARSDLNFDNCDTLIKGSGFKCNNGATIVLKKDENIPKGYTLCPGNCSTCNKCMVDKKLNIAFRQH